MEKTKVFLSDWGSYNDGFIGYGWFDPDEAIKFMESKEDEELEWFISDIDNFLGVDFGTIEYCNVTSICNQIMELEELEEYAINEVVAIMEYERCDASDAIEKLGNYYFYESIESYHDFLYEDIECLINDKCPGSADFFGRYFDYKEYYRDCDNDIFEASNGIVIA